MTNTSPDPTPDSNPNSRRRIAVVLFNIGGPDNLAAVRPFLYNLFSDPAIITLPFGIRHLVAGLLAWRRAPTARAIYSLIGGGSPIRPGTEAQATALEKKLNSHGYKNTDFRCFISMRYWRPRAHQVVQEVKDFAPDEIILLPLFPQFSTTTVGTALNEWQRVAKVVGLDTQTHACCCFPIEKEFVEAHADGIIKAIDGRADDKPYRILFSAHSLPQKIVDAGDPYVWQIGQTADALMQRLREKTGREDIDHAVCYQSRVGPLKWLEPNTASEIRRAGAEGLALIVVPIAFVSEHSETLVEMDIEYAVLAAESGVPDYHRVPALGTDAGFIDALTKITFRRLGSTHSSTSDSEAGGRACPAGYPTCYLANGESKA